MTQAIVTTDPTSAIIQSVLDTVESPHTKRAYERALVDFTTWYDEQVGKPGLSKATVQRYAAELREQGTSPSSINQRLSAIRKLAREAADNDALPESVANGISKVKGIKQEGTRAGNWLTKEDAQRLLDAPNPSTLRGLRDRAIIAVSLGCGLRRSEITSLDYRHIQQRDGRWCIVDLVGKRGKKRTVPMPNWCKKAIDEWAISAAMAEGYMDAPTSGFVFLPLDKGEHIDHSRKQITPQTVYDTLAVYTRKLELDIAPHDLRRSFAKLAWKGGSALDQISLSLGHAQLSTTQKYLGLEQDLTDAPCDHLGLRIADETGK